MTSCLQCLRAISIAALLVILLPASADEPAHADEHEAHHDGETTALDAVVVESTRSRRRVSDEPIRVEVVEREEIEEKLLMTPGNIAMLVAETAGLRVQVTSPALGAANIRTHGMRGRYTQLLADGLPLYGGQSSSIGLLQVPPTDLGRVEIIKGTASALYGPSALGGVINLISRRPSDARETEFLLNTTSRDGRDLTAYTSAPINDEWRWSVVGGAHEQSRHDVNGDGWIDMPSYLRQTLRPRVFWQSESGATALLTMGATSEERAGGTLPGRVVPDGGRFRLAQDTERVDAGAVVELAVREIDRLQFRASAMATEHTHRYGPDVDQDSHETFFGEASYLSNIGHATWLAGVALQSDVFES